MIVYQNKLFRVYLILRFLCADIIQQYSFSQFFCKKTSPNLVRAKINTLKVYILNKFNIFNTF